MSVKTAILATPIGRQDEDERGRASDAGQQRHDKTEGGRERRLRLGHDFMQGAAGQAAFRQMRIQRGKAEGQDFGQTFLP